MAEGDADSVISQYKKFLEEVVPRNKSKLLDSSHRVDQLYHGLLAGSDDCGQLWSVVKMVWFLSHGQATVERDSRQTGKWMMTIYMLTHSAVDV